jgi:hypothetical protein
MLHRSAQLLLVAFTILVVWSVVPGEAKARINFFHAVAGGPTVDIQLQSKINTTAHAIFNDLEYAEYTDYYHAEGGIYDIRVVSHEDSSKVVMVLENKLLISGVDYTMVLSGLLSDQEKFPLRVIPFLDDNTEPDDGQARFRFIHAAAGFNQLDVVLGGRKIFTRVRFGEHGELVGTGYADVDSDKYTLLVTERGLTFDDTTLSLDDGDVLTVYAVGVRSSEQYEPTLVSQITQENDDSASATLHSWMTLWL